MEPIIPYTSPQFHVNGFNCPSCYAYAEQGWGRPQFMVDGAVLGVDDRYWTSRCTRCKIYSIWIDKKLVFPLTKTAPLPNPDLPIEIKADFEEARDIVSNSPRGAAALLRLCIQKICKHLGESGVNINSDIAALVRKGLSPKVQKALDIVRVVGNNAVHPGQIDLKDDVDTANKLFGLVNLIADVMITQPKHVDELFDFVVPDSAKNAISLRDGTGG